MMERVGKRFRDCARKSILEPGRGFVMVMVGDCSCAACVRRFSLSKR